MWSSINDAEWNLVNNQEDMCLKNIDDDVLDHFNSHMNEVNDFVIAIQNSIQEDLSSDISVIKDELVQTDTLVTMEDWQDGEVHWFIPAIDLHITLLGAWGVQYEHRYLGSMFEAWDFPPTDNFLFTTTGSLLFSKNLKIKGLWIFPMNPGSITVIFKNQNVAIYTWEKTYKKTKYGTWQQILFEHWILIDKILIKGNVHVDNLYVRVQYKLDTTNADLIPKQIKKKSENSNSYDQDDIEEAKRLIFTFGSEKTIIPQIAQIRENLELEDKIFNKDLKQNMTAQQIRIDFNQFSNLDVFEDSSDSSTQEGNPVKNSKLKDFSTKRKGNQEVESWRNLFKRPMTARTTNIKNFNFEPSNFGSRAPHGKINVGSRAPSGVLHTQSASNLPPNKKINAQTLYSILERQQEFSKPQYNTTFKKSELKSVTEKNLVGLMKSIAKNDTHSSSGVELKMMSRPQSAVSKTRSTRSPIPLQTKVKIQKLIKTDDLTASNWRDEMNLNSCRSDIAKQYPHLKINQKEKEAGSQTERARSNVNPTIRVQEQDSPHKRRQTTIEADSIRMSASQTQTMSSISTPTSIRVNIKNGYDLVQLEDEIRSVEPTYKSSTHSVKSIKSSIPKARPKPRRKWSSRPSTAARIAKPNVLLRSSPSIEKYNLVSPMASANAYAWPLRGSLLKETSEFGVMFKRGYLWEEPPKHARLGVSASTLKRVKSSKKRKM